MDETLSEGEITRKIILEASLKLFSRKGYEGTSLSEICKATGLTKGALYWHFENKRVLYFEMMAEVIETFKVEFFKIIDQHTDSFSKLKMIYTRFVELVTENEKIKELMNLYIIDLHFLENSEEERHIWQWYDENLIAEYFTQAIDNGNISGSLSAVQYAFIYEGLFDIFITKCKFKDQELPLKEWSLDLFNHIFR